MHPGSEVPKPNPGASKLKSRPQDERAKRKVPFFAFFAGEPLIQGKAYVRRDLYVFLYSYRAKHIQALVLILQSYSQIFIVLKDIDGNLVQLIWTTKNGEISSVSGLVTKLSNQ